MARNEEYLNTEHGKEDEGALGPGTFEGNVVRQDEIVMPSDQQARDSSLVRRIIDSLKGLLDDVAGEDIQ